MMPASNINMRARYYVRGLRKGRTADLLSLFTGVTVVLRPSRLSLLKNELRLIEWGRAERAALPISCGSTLIAMMQTARLRKGNNIARRGKLYLASSFSHVQVLLWDSNTRDF
jgi:hypothetical protein